MRLPPESGLTQLEYDVAMAGFSTELHRFTASLASIDCKKDAPDAPKSDCLLDQKILIGLRKFISHINDFHASANAIEILGGELKPEDVACLVTLDEVFANVLIRAMETLNVSPTLH